MVLEKHLMTGGLSGCQALQAPVCGSCCFGRIGKDEQSWLSDNAFWRDLTLSINAGGSHLLTRVEQSLKWSSVSLTAYPKGSRQQTSQLLPLSQPVLAVTELRGAGESLVSHEEWSPLEMAPGPHCRSARSSLGRGHAM